MHVNYECGEKLRKDALTIEDLKCVIFQCSRLIRNVKSKLKVGITLNFDKNFNNCGNHGYKA